jgi:hypothetical protein
LLLAVLTSKSDQAPSNKPRSAQTVQPLPKSPQTLAAAKFFYPTIQCNCSACNATCDPGRWVTEKAYFFALIVGLAGLRARAIRVARSGANRSAIHYVSALRPFTVRYLGHGLLPRGKTLNSQHLQIRWLPLSLPTKSLIECQQYWTLLSDSRGFN